MRFGNSAWLWVLAALPIVGAVLFYEVRLRLKLFGKIIHPKLWETVVPELDPRSRFRRAVVWCAALGFALVAMARPQWGMHEETTKTTGLDIMVALDISSSMNTEDVVPSRLKKAKRLLKTLSERMAGDRMGLVFFARGAYLASPLTTDTEYFRRVVETAESDLLKSQGTNLGAGLEVALKAVDRGAEQTQGPGAKAATVVLLVSDGEDHEEGATERAKNLAERGIRFLVVGVGTEKGAPIPVRDDSGTLRGYKRDAKGGVITSAFNPTALKSLAEVGRGRFWNMTSAEGEIDEIVGDLTSLSRGELDERKVMVYEERFQYPLGAAILLFLIEMAIPLRRRKKTLAASVKSGVTQNTVAVLILVFLASGISNVFGPSAQAAGPGVKAWLENEKGIGELRKGQIAEAQKHFGTAQALAPESAALQFNQGTTQFAAGDLESAEKLLNEAVEKSRKSASGANAKLGGEAHFNLGALKMKQKKPEDAIREYVEAIRSAQQAKDEALEKDARKNLELAVQQMQQQKQGGKSDKNDKNQKNQKDQSKSESGESKPGDQKGEGQEDPNSKDQKDPKDPQDGKDSKDGQDSKDPKDSKDGDSKQKLDQRYQQNKKQSFQSKKLSEEDVERVMSELANRERELKARMNKRNAGNAEPNANGKDW